MNFHPQSGSNSPIDPDQVGRATQIVTIALALGLCSFAGVAIFMTRDLRPAGAPMLAWMGVGLAVMLIVVSFALARFVTASQIRRLADVIRQDARRALAPIYQARAIQTRAPPEGAAFFNLIAYIVDGQPWTLGIVFVLLVMLLVPFPSQTDFENWAEQVRRDLPL